MKKDLKEAISWLEKILGNHSFQISPLRQEASERSYFRITLKNDSYVLMNNFGSKENAANFIKIQKILKDEKVNVPDIFGFSDELDYLLLEDLGDITLDEYDELSEEDFLNIASVELEKIRSIPNFSIEENISPEIHHSQTEEFLNFFYDKKIDISSEEKLLIEELRNSISSKLAEQAIVPTHFDYERRNMIFYNDKIHIIDFQDLKSGPISMDAASLILEHKFNYSEELVTRFSKRLIGDDLQTEIYVALAHRSMRIIGTFNRYFKEGKLLNRQKDISLFVDRLLLALRYLNEKDTLKVVEKLI